MRCSCQCKNSVCMQKFSIARLMHRKTNAINPNLFIHFFLPLQTFVMLHGHQEEEEKKKPNFSYVSRSNT